MIVLLFSFSFFCDCFSFLLRIISWYDKNKEINKEANKEVNEVLLKLIRFYGVWLFIILSFNFILTFWSEYRKLWNTHIPKEHIFKFKHIYIYLLIGLIILIILFVTILYPILLLTIEWVGGGSSAFNQLVDYTVCGNTNKLLPWLSVNYKIKIFKFYNSLPFFNRYNKVDTALIFFLLDETSAYEDLIRKTWLKIRIIDPSPSIISISTKQSLFEILYYYEIGLASLTQKTSKFVSNCHNNLSSLFYIILKKFNMQPIEKNEIKEILRAHRI
jgi:hypothetical protein